MTGLEGYTLDRNQITVEGTPVEGFQDLIFHSFTAALGLHRAPRAFSSCVSRDWSLAVVHRLLIAAASLVVEPWPVRLPQEL